MTQQAPAIQSVLNTSHSGKPNQIYLSTIRVLYIEFPNGYHQHIARIHRHYITLAINSDVTIIMFLEG